MQGKSPLMWAKEKGYAKIIEILNAHHEHNDLKQVMNDDVEQRLINNDRDQNEERYRCFQCNMM